MKKIAMIFHASEIGGGEKHIQTLLAGLDRTKYDISLVCMTSGEVLNRFLYGIRQDFKLIDIAAEINKNINNSAILRNIWHLQRAYFLWNVYKYFRNNRFNIVHVHNPYSATRYGLIAKITGKKIISTTHGGYEQYFIYKTGIAKVYERLKTILRYKITGYLSDKIIAVSNANMNSLVRDIGIKENKIRVIHNGIVGKESLNADYRKELGIPEQFKIISMVAHLRPEKGHEIFLKAMPAVLKSIPELKFIIAGDGPCFSYLKKLSENMNISNYVIFLKHTDNPEEVINISDVIVLSSHTEGLPMSLIEAVSFGKPIIATDVGGVREIVKDGVNGYLVKKGDYESLSEKIILLINDPAMSNKMSKESYCIFSENYTSEKMIKTTEDLYNKIEIDIY